MESKPLTLKILDIVSILVLIAATYMALNAPTERVMGEVQKVFYFHIGTAFFFALFAFTIIFIDLFWNRIRLGDLQDKVEQLKLKVTM